MSNETSGYEPPKTENFKFFSHRQCEYFPCHQLKGGMAEEDFNCLFCYCPLYALGEDCGGNFTYYKGVKDCTDCLILTVTMPTIISLHASVNLWCWRRKRSR